MKERVSGDVSSPSPWPMKDAIIGLEDTHEVNGDDMRGYGSRYSYDTHDSW